MEVGPGPRPITSTWLPTTSRPWRATANPASPYHGNVYAVWDGPGGLNFARTLDRGATWIGTGATPAGSVLSPSSFAPDVFVAQDGTVYVVFVEFAPGSTNVMFVKSSDGGNSFSLPKSTATGITPIPGQLPGGTFRNGSIAVGCVGRTSSDVVVAWPDYQTSVSRIFSVYTNNGGTSWHGGTSGQQLLTGAAASAGDQHEIQPQLASTPDGTIGCAFYQFGPKTPGGRSLIDVVLAATPPTG